MIGRALRRLNQRGIPGRTAEWALRSLLALRGDGGVLIKIGAHKFGLSALLQDVHDLGAPADSELLVGDGTTYVLESGATVRASLGLVIGTDVQAYSAALDDLDVAGVVPGSDRFLGSTGMGAPAWRTATQSRSDLGLGSLATQSTIDDGDWSGTDLAVDNGGTGQSALWGQVSGLKIKWSSTAQISISSGACADSSNAVWLVSPTSVLLWPASSLDTGSEASSTWYYVWMFGSTGGAITFRLSASYTSPVVPAGYTYKRRIGSVYNDASKNLQKFYQRGSGRSREYLWGDSPTYFARRPVGHATSSTWKNVTVPSYAPSTADALLLSVLGYDSTPSGGVSLDVYGGTAAMYAINPPPSGAMGNTANFWIPCPGTIGFAWMSNTTIYITAMGWSEEL